MHFWRTFGALFRGLFVANPLPPPFSKPPKETTAETKMTAGFLYSAGAETTPNFREIFRASLRTIYSTVDTQTAVPGSTAKVWISAPETQTFVFLGFLGIDRCFLFSCPRTKSS